VETERQITAGFLMPKEAEAEILKENAGKTLNSLKTVTLYISAAIVYENPSEKERAEAIVGDMLRELNPDNRYDMVINSGPAEKGVISEKDENSI